MGILYVPVLLKKFEFDQTGLDQITVWYSVTAAELWFVYRPFHVYYRLAQIRDNVIKHKVTLANRWASLE